MAKKVRWRQPEPTPVQGDVALVYGKDQHGLHVLRRRSHDAPVEAGVLQPLTEGRPITGEVISLRARDDLPLVFDVKTEIAAAATAEGERHGPSRAATDAYRKGWDGIWGRRGRRPGGDPGTLN